MAGRRLNRWQKAGAVVPMAALVGVWSAALAGPGVAVGSADGEEFVPDVPEVAISQPASVAGDSGLDPAAGVDGALETLSTNGIPSVALAAYRRSELLLSQADPDCNLPWNLVAAIGRVESNHGRINGSTLDADGTANPGIYGIPLDGTNGTARISDTDDGALDNDTEWDRAVGPMQFIPSTWELVGLDANGDGVADPQNIYDSAVAAGVYLCAGDGDLSDREDASSALFRYNRSSTYVQNVLAISDAYAAGDFTQVANGYSAAPAITARENDQTLTERQRERARTERTERAERQAAEREATESGSSNSGSNNSGGSNSSGSGGSSGGSSGGDSGNSGGGSTGGGSGSGSTGVGKVVEDTVDGVGKVVEDTVNGVGQVLTRAAAELQCGLQHPIRLSAAQRDAFNECVTRLTTPR